MEKYLKVKQAIKRKFPVIESNESIQAAINLMAEADVSVLAVEAHKELIGMITVSDVMQGIANDYDLQKTKISIFMTECRIDNKISTAGTCIQLDEDQDVISAIKVMYEGGINHLLVTGEKNKPLGIVSSLELVKLIASN
jgi:predicted transcriptional regulator